MRRQPLRFALLLVLTALPLFGATVAGTAQADTATCGVDRPWVLMQLSELDPDFAARLISDLRAGLAPSRIDACVAEAIERKAPLATVRIAGVAGRELVFSIDVSDSVTEKRIGRDIDLRHVPSDGRAFALAVAADELLRASWAELALAKERQPKPQPPEPKPAPRLPPEPAPVEPPALTQPSFTALGVGLGLEAYTGGQLHFGVDAFWLQPLTGWLRFGLTAGVRRGLTVDAPSGSIGSRAIHVELSLRPTLVSSSIFSLDALVGLRGSEVWFVPEPIAGAEATKTNSAALFGRGGLALTLGRAGSVRSVTTLGAGGPLRSFSASDGGEVVTGVSGVEFFATSGVALEF